MPSSPPWFLLKFQKKILLPRRAKKWPCVFNGHYNILSRLLWSVVILHIKWRIGREGKSMGGTNPDTLSGATITVERRAGQMEARALGGPSYLSYTRAFVYNVLALRDSPRSFLRGFSRLPLSPPRGCSARIGTRTLWRGWRASNPPRRTSADHTVFILLKQQDSARRDYRKRVPMISLSIETATHVCGSYYCRIVGGKSFQSWMLGIRILLMHAPLFKNREFKLHRSCLRDRIFWLSREAHFSYTNKLLYYKIMF